ncbi:MAG: hypothetical protein AAF993_00355 [Pseudomonadota bacterium]
MKAAVQVDLVSELALTPGIRLLIKHLEQLGVALVLREDLNQVTGNRVLLIPRRKHSRWDAQLQPDPHGHPEKKNHKKAERVALYLDPATQPIHAERHFHADSWPARSSDRHVTALADYLRSPLLDEVAAASPKPTRKPWSGKPLAAAGFLASIVFVSSVVEYQTELRPIARSQQSLESGAANAPAANPATHAAAYPPTHPATHSNKQHEETVGDAPACRDLFCQVHILYADTAYPLCVTSSAPTAPLAEAVASASTTTPEGIEPARSK